MAGDDLQGKARTLMRVRLRADAKVNEGWDEDNARVQVVNPGVLCFRTLFRHTVHFRKRITFWWFVLIYSRILLDTSATVS